MSHPDDPGRRLSEALHAQASRGPLPPPTAPPPMGPPPAPRPLHPAARPAPAPPPRIPGRVPPPAPRPVAPPAQAEPRPVAGSSRQIVWALVVTLLVGAILGGGLALLSVLVPGLLPAIG